MENCRESAKMLEKCLKNPKESQRIHRILSGILENSPRIRVKVLKSWKSLKNPKESCRQRSRILKESRKIPKNPSKTVENPWKSTEDPRSSPPISKNAQESQRISKNPWKIPKNPSETVENPVPIHQFIISFITTAIIIKLPNNCQTIGRPGLSRGAI